MNGAVSFFKKWFCKKKLLLCYLQLGISGYHSTLYTALKSCKWFSSISSCFELLFILVLTPAHDWTTSGILTWSHLLFSVRHVCTFVLCVPQLLLFKCSLCCGYMCCSDWRLSLPVRSYQPLTCNDLSLLYLWDWVSFRVTDRLCLGVLCTHTHTHECLFVCVSGFSLLIGHYLSTPQTEHYLQMPIRNCVCCS